MDNKYLLDLADAITTLKTKKEVVDFLEGILTPQELIEVPTRLQIVKMLKKGIPQHEIAKKLGVGIATVTRGSKEIARGKFSQVSSAGWQPLASGG